MKLSIRIAATTLSGQCRFVRVELPTATGAAIGDFYKCRYTPSYLVFDEHGLGELAGQHVSGACRLGAAAAPVVRADVVARAELLEITG